MGLTKQYLRYVPSGTFNVIASSDCNSTHITLNGVSGRYIAVGACEHVIIWDMRLGEKAQVIPGENVMVSQIAASPTGNHLAVGYVDGNINVFELTNNEVVCVFAGHKSGVTCLQYDEAGTRIVSGSKDTEVILWDVVSETGLARFSGHKGIITSVLFLNGKNCIVSSSKDTFVKFWDIETKHCFKTLGGHQMEILEDLLRVPVYFARAQKGITTTKRSIEFVKEGSSKIKKTKQQPHSILEAACDWTIMMDTYEKQYRIPEDIVVSSSRPDIFLYSRQLKRVILVELTVPWETNIPKDHTFKVWSAVLLKEERYLVTGSMDQELRVWKLNWNDKIKEEDKIIQQLEIVKLEDTDTTEDSSILQCHQVGTLIRGGKGRVVGLATDLGQTVLACFGTDSLLELFAFCSDGEAKARMNKRVKKQRKKMSKLKESGEIDTETTEVAEILTLSDEVRRLSSVKLSAKLKSTALLLGTTGELRVGVTLNTNTVELHSLDLAEGKEVVCLKQVTQAGHRREVRCVALSSDNLAVLSASDDCVKLWNRTSQACLRTIPLSGCRPVAACMAPGDRHALVACSDGALLLLDASAAAVLEQVPAHTAACSCVGLTPDLRGCYTGGSDKTVKLWQFELIPDPSGDSKAKVLSVLHTRTLELEEAVTSVRVSQNNKYIAVALLDSTVKIFFYDTFKFYLSLYGHKLPVLALDMSSDCSIIATGSADRNVKIWGLDFGDCHKSIFAHNDSITSLQFVPGTHYFFTSSKDGKIKQWDGDTYANIITLDGHVGGCWCVCVGAGGLQAASCGADGALRLAARSDEPLVLGDRDDEEEGLATGDRAPVPGMPGLVMPTRKTIGAEKAADSIVECLSVCAEYDQLVLEARGQPVAPPVLMAAFNCTNSEDFLRDTICRIRASELEEALLLLPLGAGVALVPRLASLLERAWSEPLCRAALFVVRVTPALAQPALLKHLIQIQARAAMRVAEIRDMVGFNLHALQWARREAEAAAGEQLFRDATVARKSRDRRSRTAQARKRALITIT